MTQDAPGGRGERRREQLVAAAAELLAERGWAAVTARAVAERAGTHAGLVHYHFGGLQALKREVAASAVRQAFEPAVELLIAAPDWTSGLAAVVGEATRRRNDPAGRTSAELITAALHDEDIAVLVRSLLSDARAALVPWLRATGAAEPEGLATLVLAVLDGLLLHRLIDPDLPIEQTVAALTTLASEAPSVS